MITQNPLLGKLVCSKTGQRVGFVKHVDGDQFYVTNHRLSLFNGNDGLKLHRFEEIESLEGDRIMLKPTQCEYWQMPA